MNCGIASNVAGPCSVCREYTEQVHIITDRGGIANVRLVCARCCPLHGGTGLKEWAGEPTTINGEQEMLFYPANHEEGK